MIASFRTAAGALAITLNFVPGVRADEVGEVAAALNTCYQIQAAIYGRESCHPPEQLLFTVYGACADYEAAYVKATASVLDNFIESSLAQMRNSLKPVIFKSLIDGQIHRRCR